VSAPAERPLTYRVASRLVSVGEVVAQGQSLFRLVASDRVKFRGRAPERFARELRVGVSAHLAIDGVPDAFAATLTRVAPAVDVATRTIEVEIEAANPDALLKPGGFARARILLRTDDGVRFVPESSVSQFAGVQRVFSLRDGKVTEHRVQLGNTIAGMSEVLDLPADVNVVIDHPPRGLGAGAPALPAK
jgi:membrane fusion protein (multidrug efflux system)